MVSANYATVQKGAPKTTAPTQYLSTSSFPQYYTTASSEQQQQGLVAVASQQSLLNHSDQWSTGSTGSLPGQAPDSNLDQFSVMMGSSEPVLFQDTKKKQPNITSNPSYLPSSALYNVSAHDVSLDYVA